MMTATDAASGRELRPDAYGRDLLAELPILARAADVSTRILFDLDSGDMQPHHWVELARPSARRCRGSSRRRRGWSQMLQEGRRATSEELDVLGPRPLRPLALRERDALALPQILEPGAHVDRPSAWTATRPAMVSYVRSAWLP